MPTSAADSPLSSAQQAIEQATQAAWRRTGVARTMAARLSAARALATLQGAARGNASVPPIGMTLELARLAGLQAVQAAADDDDMAGLERELGAAMLALSGD